MFILEWFFCILSLLLHLPVFCLSLPLSYQQDLCLHYYMYLAL
jgi:hypothetical protein